MPYASTAELPPAVKSRYSGKCLRAFMHAFNSTHDRTHDEARSFQSAHAAAKRCQSQKGVDMATELAANELPPLRPGMFRFVTKAMQPEVAGEGEDARMRFRAIASSTVTDLAGDEMTLGALTQMAEKLRAGLTIFFNHSKVLPEDEFGTSDGATIQQAGVDDKGNPIYDLHMEGFVNEPNPRAIQLWKSMQHGSKHGTSIGAILQQGDWEKKKDGGKRIKSLNLIEASIVGVPMNQRSWVQKALDAIDRLEVNEPVEDTEEKGAEDLAGTMKTSEPLATVHVGGCNEKCEGDSHWLMGDGDKSVSAHGRIIVDEVVVQEKAAMCADCGHSAGCGCDSCSCSAGVHNGAKSADDLELETKSGEGADESIVIQGGQEAPEATPETAPATDEATEKKVVSVEADDISELIRRANLQTETIDDLRSQNTELQKSVEKAEKARDEAQEELTVAREIISRVSKMPLQRKAVGAIGEYANRFPQYDDRIVKTLLRSNDA